MEYYIKKNDVVSMLMKEAKSHGLSFSAEAYERAANIVACMPNEDAQPVKKCKMIPQNPDCRGYTDGFICTNCQHYIDLGFMSKNYDGNFCLECGAEVEEGNTNG